MKHLNHRIITTGIALLSGAGLPGLAGALAGSVLPDLDIPLGIPHRTVTHWWLLPALGASTALIIPFSNPEWRAFCFWLSAGALLHIAEDSLTNGGVPLLRPFGKRFSFRLTRTGGILEYLLSFGILVAAGAVLVRHPELWEGWIHSAWEIQRTLNRLI
ncbi:MAG: metal-dependent hydrolase [Leptospirales bacterium]